MRINLDAGIFQHHAGIGAQRQHGAGARLVAVRNRPPTLRARVCIEIAIGGAELGIEEHVLAAPVGIAGQHVPLGVGAGGARQLLGDIAASRR